MKYRPKMMRNKRTGERARYGSHSEIRYSHHRKRGISEGKRKYRKAQYVVRGPTHGYKWYS